MAISRKHARNPAPLFPENNAALPPFSLNPALFTDFAAAESWLSTLQSDESLCARISWHLGKAFLQNQLNNFEDSLAHYAQALPLLEKANAREWTIDTLIDQAAVFTNLFDWENAEMLLTKAKKRLKSHSKPVLRAHLWCREGYLALSLGHLEQAILHFMEAEKIFDSYPTPDLKDQYLKTLVLSGMGHIYERLDEPEKSLQAYLKVLHLCEQYHLKPRLPWHYLNAGRVYLGQEQLAAAKMLFVKALETSDISDLDPRANSLANLGIIAYLEDDVAQATGLLKQAADLYDNPVKPVDFTNLSKIHGWKAQVALETNQPDAAQTHFEKALFFGEKGNDYQHVVGICTALSEFYAQAEKYKEAWEMQKKAAHIRLLLAEKVKTEKIRQLEIQFQSEKRRQEARFARMQMTGLQLRALRAQMNPHFMFNALNAISSFINTGRTDDAGIFLARFAKLMRQSLDYSYLETISLDAEIDFLKKYLDLNQKLRFDGNLKYTIELPDDLEDALIPAMILQPFVENAIEHGLRPTKGGEIRLSFTLSTDETRILAIIEDNGVGYLQGKLNAATEPGYGTHRSRGMEITEERLQLLHLEQKRHGNWVKITDLSTEGRRGTRVEVAIPLVDE